MNITIWDMLSALALITNDLFAILGTIGTVLFFLGKLIKVGLNNDKFQIPQQVGVWVLGGLLFGTIGEIALYKTGNQLEKVGITQLNQKSIIVLLVSSFLLLILAFTVPFIVDQLSNSN